MITVCTWRQMRLGFVPAAAALLLAPDSAKSQAPTGEDSLGPRTMTMEESLQRVLVEHEHEPSVEEAFRRALADLQLPPEVRQRSTPELFAELVNIRKVPSGQNTAEHNIRMGAIDNELNKRDRETHQWLADVLTTTADPTEARMALFVLADGHRTTKPRHPDIVRPTIIEAVKRSHRNEPGSADRFLLTAAFSLVGQPGDFPLLEPYLAEAAGPFADSLFMSVYRVAARGIGTEEDLPALRRHLERWRKIAEHQPPWSRDSRLTTGNHCASHLRQLEERLAAEKLAAEQPAASTEPADPDGEEAIAPQRVEEAAGPVPGGADGILPMNQDADDFFPGLPVLPDEEKERSTRDLFGELMEIKRVSPSEQTDDHVLREFMIETELAGRDRDSHHWFAERLLTTADGLEANALLTLLTDGSPSRKPTYPDLSREAVIAAVERSLRKEPGSAIRELLAAAFLDVGKPGDFPLLEPFLEEAAGPFGGSLFSTVYQVAARVIGTEEDLPALRRHVERWKKIAEHMPPGHRTSQLNFANSALARIRDLEERLAAERQAAEESPAAAGEPPDLDAMEAEVTDADPVAAVPAATLPPLDHSTAPAMWRSLTWAALLLAIAAVLILLLRRRAEARNRGIK